MAADELFMRLMASAKAESQAEVFIDTNVMVEIMSIGDLLRAFDRAGSSAAFLASPEAQYRKLRARYANLVAWWLATTNTPACIHGHEVSAVLTERIAPISPGDPSGLLGHPLVERRRNSLEFTIGIVHVIRDYVIKAPIGFAINVKHETAGEAADTEILRLCKKDELRLITNEGNAGNQVTLDKPNGERNLRGRCVDEGVTVYTPLEFLESNHVDRRSEAKALVDACERGVLRAAVDGVLMKTNSGREIMSNLLPVYRWIMLA